MRVSAGRVEIKSTGGIFQGVPVAIATLDEARPRFEIKNRLDRPVRDVEVELTLRKDVDGQDDPEAARPATAKATSAPAPDDDEAPPPEGVALGEAAMAGELHTVTPIPGWKFHFVVPEISASATGASSQTLPLPSLPPGEALPAPTEMSFAVEVSAYRADGLSLARAVEMQRLGGPADQRAALKSYGEGLSDADRRRDELLLVELLRERHDRNDRDGQNGRLARRRRGEKAPAATVEPVVSQRELLLSAARRIGGQPTLELLLTDEDRLAFGGRGDEGLEPSPGAGEPAGDGPAAFHETLVTVAHRNLASLYRLLHPASSSRRTPPRLLEAASRLAAGEGLDEPESWLEAAAIPTDADAASHNNSAGAIKLDRSQMAIALSVGGGEPARAALLRAFHGADEALRRAAAMGLAAGDAVALRALVTALDTDDEALRATIVQALSTVGAAALPSLLVIAKELEAKGDAASSQFDGTSAASIAAHLDRLFLVARTQRIEALLAYAERTAISANAADADLAANYLARAEAVSPRLYREARERVARAAASIYLTRRISRRPDAKAVLVSVRRLGEIEGQAFHAAWRTARIDDARALAAEDIDAAVDFLCAGKEVPGDADERAEALALLASDLERSLSGLKLGDAAADLSRARTLGAANADLDRWERRLSLLRTGRAVAAVAVAALLLLAFALSARLRRHPLSTSATSATAATDAGAASAARRGPSIARKRRQR